MKGFKIQIIKSKLYSYWYASCIENVYWAVLHERNDGCQYDYEIIEEGECKPEGQAKRYVDFEDCVVIKECYLSIIETKSIKIIEL